MESKLKSAAQDSVGELPFGYLHLPTTPIKQEPRLTEQKIKKVPINHGMSKKKIYKIFGAMKSRCYNKKDKKYHLYGGKGVKVCDRWMESFMNFYADMGDRPEGTSIDRINGNGNYEPSNCRWATINEQNRNLSSNKLSIESAERIRALNSDGKDINEIIKETGFSYMNIYDVLKRNRWSK